MPQTLTIYDTTLRDGNQSEGISYSVEDKIRIAQRLDEFGMDYIEGGWPGSNPKDMQFFKRARKMHWHNAKIAAFGSTRRKDARAAKDDNLRLLLEAETPVVTIFGKSWDLHVTEGLRTTEKKNLDIIYESVAYLKDQGKEVIYDAEHFFDGFKSNLDYAIQTLEAACKGGADCLVLCDTNGGVLLHEISEIIDAVLDAGFAVPLGIHTHNDSDVAVANSILAIQRGLLHVQGTINGYGERCGNANLCSIIPNVAFKLQDVFLADKVKLVELTTLSRYISEVANLPHREESPYVGNSAFAHKGGIHVSAIRRNRLTYEHVDPARIGNHQRVLISDQSGQSNILQKAEEMGHNLSGNGAELKEIVNKLKELEHLGYQFEDADGSFEVLIHKTTGNFKDYFELKSARVIIFKYEEGTLHSEAVLRLLVKDQMQHTVAEGHGPVDALDKALRKALEPFYPSLKEIRLIDYKVRVLDSKQGTGAKVRVSIESEDGKMTWGTVGVSENIIEASWQALVDRITYKLMREGDI
ncbi:citramalate synthase [candidate division KSB1 bacterium]|nr:citramalate synthase [candidate division KSB1 bacterium]RQW04278.1 MAG: citramalate synthase [candidate division KSB1 bacterium]